MAEQENQADEKGTAPWLEPVEDESGSAVRPRMRSIFLAGGVLLFLIFAGTLWFLYDRSGDDMTAEPVTIEAPPEPVRTEPEDRGGMEVEHQDKLVFEAMDGEPEGGDEKLADAPEEPVAMKDQATDAASDIPPPPPLPGEVEPSAAAEEEPRVDTRAESLAPFLVQLGAYSSQAAAEGGWRAVKDRHSVLMAGLASDIERADLGARGIFYRLRAGPLPNQDAADSLCASLKTAGQGCIVIEP